MINNKIKSFLLIKKTGSEAGIGSSPATSYTSLNLEKGNFFQVLVEVIFSAASSYIYFKEKKKLWDLIQNIT